MGAAAHLGIEWDANSVKEVKKCNNTNYTAVQIKVCIM